MYMDTCVVLGKANLISVGIVENGFQMTINKIISVMWFIIFYFPLAESEMSPTIDIHYENIFG